MKHPIKHIPVYLKNKQERVISYACRLYVNTLNIHTEEPKKEDLLKLPLWVQKAIDIYKKDKSLKKQMVGLDPPQHSRLWLSNPRIARYMEQEAQDKRRELTKQVQLSNLHYQYFDWHYRHHIRLMRERTNDCNDMCDFIDQ